MTSKNTAYVMCPLEGFGHPVRVLLNFSILQLLPPHHPRLPLQLIGNIGLAKGSLRFSWKMLMEKPE